MARSIDLDKAYGKSVGKGYGWYWNLEFKEALWEQFNPCFIESLV